MSGEHEDHVTQPADSARGRLAALQQDAAAVYAVIAQADENLRRLAVRRVAAERDLRLWGTRHLVAAKVAAAHALDRPGPFAQLTTRFRAGQEWRARQNAIEAVIAETDGSLGAAQHALNAVRAEFAVTVQARADAVARLRRLTAECAAARDGDAIGRDGPAVEADCDRQRPACG